MALKLITAPSTYPVTLAEARLQARMDDTVLDTRITAYISAATGMAEQATGRALMAQTWELSLDAFPVGFALTRIPVASITSLKYWDAAGVQQTLSSTLYTLQSSDDFGSASVEPAYGTAWPAARAQTNSVALRYAAGYADAASVPEGVKNWILLMVAAMVDNPALESSTQTYSLGFADRLLDAAKVWDR
jgi:uncharacterized phiE125 gp8 family phage protein